MSNKVIISLFLHLGWIIYCLGSVDLAASRFLKASSAAAKWVVVTTRQT